MRRPGRSSPLAGAAGLLAAALTLHLAAARAEDSGTFTFQTENDFFAPITNSDRHYTNGLRFAWLSPATSVPDWIAIATDIPSLFGPDETAAAVRRVGVAIGHNIFTPDDTQRAALVRDDRPYAAWLYLALSLNTLRTLGDGSARFDVFQLDLGVIGPAAGGEWVQNHYHDLINVDTAKGWRNQLRDEPAIDLAFQRRWRTARLPFEGRDAACQPGEICADVIPHYILTLGTVFAYAGAGALARIGDLPDDFGPPRIRPGLPGSESFESGGAFRWYAFAGLEGRAIARNAFLDGNLWRDSHGVSKRPVVGDFQFGLALLFPRLRVTYTHVILSPEFHKQSQWDQFGALSLSWNL